MSSLQKSLLKGKLPPVSLSGRGGQKVLKARRRDYTPVSWSQYFQKCEDIEVSEGNTFRVYMSGDTGPVLVLLHGGGFSGLTWSLFSAAVTSMVQCQVLAIDQRGHGDTSTTNDEDLSAQTMASDVKNVIECIYGEDAPPIILIGHSMGGAIAVHVASSCLLSTLIGLAVIDVVEGTAMDALTSMQSFLRGRPSYFKSLEHAIEWCVRSGQVRNVESAKVSMPGQLKNCQTGQLATNEVANYIPVLGVPEKASSSVLTESISEEDTETDTNNSNPTSPDTIKPFKTPISVTDNDNDLRKYTWRIDLGRTENYWSGWFKGLSNTFLSCSVPKMLLLAGIDRLDKDLTVGQMQGKFQMQVLPQCGHAVHEDVPDKVAEVVATFIVRHKFAEPASDFIRTFPAC